MENILYPLIDALHGIHKHVHFLKLITMFILFFDKKERSLIERKIQYVKDRTESFDDYFPCCKKQNCKLEHIKQWIKGVCISS
ncbi:MAG: hypothetical protein R2685_15780 [Candidatus Nitrosocosmicus sp.]|nr:hypothetical protein [Candidatus Nitrosocosmicus sp.]